MPTRHTKLIIGACLLLGIMGCSITKIIATATENSAGQLPRRTVVIMIDASQRQAFFDQLRKFADKHDFSIMIDTRPPGVEGFYIDMYRRDIEINGTNPFAPEEYQLGIYDADPNRPVSDTILDNLVNDLKNFINEVPDVTIVEEK